MAAKEPKNIVVLGAGSIGVAFAAVFADHGWHVTLVEPDDTRREAARAGLATQVEAIALAGLTRGDGGCVARCAKADEAMSNGDIILECGPEDLAVKQKIFADVLRQAHPEAVLATASSAMTVSQIVTQQELQARCLVAHPVNPPSVLRLIEICPAPGTSADTTETARALFESAGFDPVVLSGEVEGFVLNRLQGAVLREAYRLVDEDIVEPDDIDRVMRLGLGPRWALSGPFETAELNTPGGIAAHAERMGAAYKRMGEERGETVVWSPALVDRVAQARDKARGEVEISERVAWRSTAVAKLVDMRDRLLKGGE